MSVERRLAQSEAREKVLVERLNQSRKALGYAVGKLEEKGFDCGCDMSVGMPCESHREVELARETVLKNSSNERRALDLEKWRAIEDYKRSIFEILEKRIHTQEVNSPDSDPEEERTPDVKLFEALGPLLRELKQNVLHEAVDSVRTLKNPFGETE